MTGSHNTYTFVTLSIFQSQFTEKGFNKTDNFEHCVVLLLFLFTLDIINTRYITSAIGTSSKKDGSF